MHTRRSRDAWHGRHAFSRYTLNTKPGYSGTLHIDALLYGATAQMATTVKLADVLRSAKDDKLYAALSHCNASDACRRRPCPSRLG
jgi:hypothetical protein